MAPEATLLVLPLLAWFIAMPACAAWFRRRRSRLASQAATELATFAQAVRGASSCLPLDATLRDRLVRLRLREWSALELAIEVGRDAGMLAEVAQRLALRLHRRVAFDRKMLARTGSGLRRGAIAASLPPVLVLLLLAMQVPIPTALIGGLLLVEALANALLWRLSSIEI